MSKTILIVEDDLFLQGLEATRLKKEGYDILSAANSVETYAIIDGRRQVDLILLDLMLPEVDGFTILEKIRKDKLYGTVPVIVFSNLSEEQDIERAKKMVISEFLIKSNFDLGQLTKKIKDLIGVKKIIYGKNNNHSRR